ncbi:transglycosylase family protein [Glutamicibacter protophormiae]|uniref:LysM peptidoglycan-binding domain-containing protein n=2 Tax=Kocuria TaxID=57493 RepID=UPI0006D84072|nr:transglycosylase family protein [Kocuria salsicia]WNB87711.1 transglycosylase family protein [Glutamicibacter protophormiae]
MMKTSTAIRRGAAAVVMGGVAVGAFAVPANAAPSLDAIKQCESGGDYQALNASSGASGAYQFLDSTWAGMSQSAGYAHAADAPAAVQDAAAAELMARSGASQWECSSMISSGSYSAPAAAASVSTQSSSVQEAAPVEQAAPAAQQAAPVKETAPVQETAPAQESAPVAQAPVVEYSAPAAPVQQAAPAAGTYTVQAGDTLGTIANKLGVNGGWEALHAANSGSVADANLIFPGQVLNIPA